ncbi:hypothetical protein VHEMI06360 [[Torrubiella] hemipterigena]|uniref:N-acetyltransferase domain-containing protein n=1 Tax=[Torrubiella] hemipterigena TaxID=1531966 RepID=A0A0A1TIX9_9HYPO|nr:hypothetical protein VHEMI06360 [[Torrubiella] hemipterigena]
MHPYRSKNLEFTSFDAAKHDEALFQIHSQAESWIKGTPQLKGPMDRKYHDKVVTNLQELFLFVVINKVVVNTDSEEPAGQRTLIPIGRVSLKHTGLDMTHHRSCSVGILIGEEYQGQGYGAETVSWLLDWAFKYANMNRVELNVFEWNLRAIEMYKRVGFKEEGRKRQALWHDGRFWDDVGMGILQSEWREMRAKESQVIS